MENRLISIFLLAVCVPFSQAVIAETAQEPVLEELLVTAERVQKNVQDTPIAITAITDDAIRDFGMIGPEDIGVLVPSFSRSTFDVTLRGIGRNFRNVGGDPGVASYYNGIYSEDVFIGATESRLYDLERIEILRGPQGTLYGRNAIAGVVNYITKRPTREFFAELFTRVDHYGSKEVNGVVSGPLIEDRLLARLMGSWLDAGEDRESKAAPGQRALRDTGGGMDKNLALTLDFLPLDNVDIRLRANHRKFETDPRAQLQIGEGETNRQQRSSAVCLLEGTDCFAEPAFDGSFLATLNSSANQDLPINGNGYGKDLKNEAYPDVRPQSSMTIDAITLDGRWHFGYDQFTLRYVGGYSDNDYAITTAQSPTGGRNTCIPPDCSTGADGEQIRADILDVTQDIDSFSNELQLISNLDGRWNFIAGLYQYQARHTQTIAAQDVAHLGTFTVDPSYGLLGPDPFGPPLSRGWHENGVNGPGASASWGGDAEGTYFWFEANNKVDTFAAYGQAYFDITDQLRLTLGGRWSRDQKEASERRFAYVEVDIGIPLDQLNSLLTTDPATFAPNGEPLRLFGFPISYQDGVNIEDDWSRTSWRVNLDWRPDDRSLGYASVTTGYRAGGFNLGFNQQFSFDEEEVISYEVGYKIELLNRTLRLNTALYYYDYTDQQVKAVAPISDPEDPTFVYNADVVQNLPEARNWGFEVESVWRLRPALLIGGLYSYMNTKITADFFVAQLGNPWADNFEPEPLNVKGNQLNRAPEQKFTIWGDYTWPLGRNGRLNLLTSYSYTGTQYQDVTNARINKTPAFGRWDLRLNWDSPAERFRLSVYGTNLTNELGIREMYAGRNFSRTVDTTPPRVVGLEFRMRFGTWEQKSPMDRSSNLPQN